MVKTIEERMIERLDKSGFDKRFICEKTGIDKNDLFLLMENERKLKTDEFVSLCVFLGLNISDFDK